MENSKKFTTKNIVIIAAIVVAVLAIILAIVFLSNNTVNFNDLENVSENYTVASPREDKPILYIKNGALLAKFSDGSGDAATLSDNLCSGDVLESASVYSNLVKQSKSAEATYFIKDFVKKDYTGTLNVTTDHKTAVELDTNVVAEIGYDYLKMSDNGKTVVYMKNLVKTEDELYADLYYRNIDDSEPVMIAKELYGMQTDYLISSNGEYIAAYSDYNTDKQVGGLMILKNGEDAKPLVIENASNIKLVSLTNDGKLIYTLTTSDSDGNNQKEKVSIVNYEDMQTKTYGEDIDGANVYVSDKSDKIVYLDYSADNILVYSASYNSEPKLITDNYYGFTSIDVENECYIFAKAEGDEKYAVTKKVYIKTPETAEAVLLSDKISIPSDVKQSVDYKTFYYLSESSLYTASLIDGKLSESEKIADNVHDFKVSQGGNSVVFDTDYKEEEKTSNLKAYTKESKSVKNIADNLKLEYVNLSIDGLAVVYTDALSTEQSNGFTAKLSHYNLYGKNKTTILSDYASMMFYYYDQYLASTSDEAITPRNRYHVRSGNSVLFYTDVGSDCKSGNLVLFKDGKDTIVDNDVMTVLFE